MLLSPKCVSIRGKSSQKKELSWFSEIPLKPPRSQLHNIWIHMDSKRMKDVSDDLHEYSLWEHYSDLHSTSTGVLPSLISPTEFPKTEVQHFCWDFSSAQSRRVCTWGQFFASLESYDVQRDRQLGCRRSRTWRSAYERCWRRYVKGFFLGRERNFLGDRKNTHRGSIFSYSKFSYSTLVSPNQLHV